MSIVTDALAALPATVHKDKVWLVDKEFYFAWPLINQRADIDGEFTAADLRALADFMDSHPAKTPSNPV